MRIAFMGTPEFALPTLDRIVSDGHTIAVVYTQPPRPAGRGKAVMPGAVQRRADALGLPVRTPETMRDPSEQEDFRALSVDVAVVAAYGLILPPAILAAPRLGCLNVHGSLLPRWRGAAPVQRAILAGDIETGVTIMDMERGLDTGPMRLVRRVVIGDMTGGALAGELAAIGAGAMSEVLANLEDYAPVPQPNQGVTYAAKIEKHETRIDFSRSAVEVLRQVRAFAPAPGAFFEHEGERIRVVEAEVVVANDSAGMVLDTLLTIACEAGALRPTRVQRGGRAIMDTADLLRGFAMPPGTRVS